jgi:hypothetical protein
LSTRNQEIVAAGDVRAFFQERVTEVLGRRNLKVEETTQFYLVNLLSEFAHAEQLFEPSDDGRREAVPLALLLARALEQPPEARLRTFKRMGDTSLYVSGFFSDSLARKLVDVDYYIAMGGRAYESAADLVEPQAGTGRTFAGIFAELSEKFGRLVDCLMEISEDAQTTRTDGLVRMYERWLHTRSERLARRLADQGLLPSDPGGAGRLVH